MKTNGRGKRNSMALTPQPTKRNDAKSRRSVSSLNLDSGERSPNDTVFNTLMSDPVKRKMIMKLLSQERENIEKYKQDENKKVSKLKRTDRLLHCESPTALLRRRALEKNRRDSDSSSTTSTSDIRSIPATPVPFECVLRGVVAYVEIRSKEGDRSAGAKALMEAMGATVKDDFSTEVTHVVFKDGSFTTYQKAKLKKVHLVSVLWLEAVRKNNFRVPEKNYPALGTEVFDVNITQIYSDYEKVVNEEKRRSHARGLPSGYLGRKTALPAELKSIKYNLDIASPTIGARVSEGIIPSSQDWEAESVISCASGTLPFRRTVATVQDEDSDRFGISTPELTSDNDSDCGVIDGHSFRRDSCLDLDILEEVQTEPELGSTNALNIPGASDVNNISINTSNNTSSTRSISLLPRKSGQNRKSSYKLVDMDLTRNISFNKENVNLKLKRSAKKVKRDSSLLSDNSTNLLDEIPNTNVRQTENKFRRSTCKKLSLVPNDQLFKEPYVNLGNTRMKFYSIDDLSIINSSNKSLNSVRVTRSTSDLSGKNQKKYSVSSDETASLRFSTSSKDTTGKKNNSASIRTSEMGNGEKKQDKGTSNSDQMPSLRISTSISSNETSNRKRSAQMSGDVIVDEGGQKPPSSHSEEMPSLRISSNSPSNGVPGKKKNKNHDSKSFSLTEDMPSLRISSSSNDASNRIKTRSSTSASSYQKNRTEDTQKSSNKEESEKKKRGSRSPPQVTSTLMKKRKLESSELVGQTSGKIESFNSENTSSMEISSDVGGKKRKASKSKQEVEKDQNVEEKNRLRSSRSPRTSSGSLISEDMPSLRISTGDSNNIIEKPKDDTSNLLKEDSAEKSKSIRSLRKIHKITRIPDKQNEGNGKGEDTSHSEETNQAKSGGSPHNSDDEHNLTNPSRTRSGSKNATPLDGNGDTDIISSLDAPKTPKDFNNKKHNEGSQDKTENKKYRKLYNLNQPVEETLKNFEWPDNAENNKDKGDAPTTATSNNMVPKTTVTVPLIPIPITPIAKQLIERRNVKETKAKKEKVRKKDPPKPTKKVRLDCSKDEQKELTDEYVNKATKRKMDANEESQPEIKRSARISRRSQGQKHNYKEKSPNSDSDSDERITPERNRRSTFEFVKKSTTKSQKKAIRRKKVSSIVCTRLHKPEVQTFMQIVKKLGCYFVQDEVTEKTTHLVVGESKRTINLLKALARGCWILKQEWLYRSLEAEKWLPEEDFEVTDFSPAIQQCRLERRAFGSLYSMDIFENCGPIYIARSSIPRRSDLQELVQMCKGSVTNISYNARVVVGEWVRYANVKCVTEMWILDSITFNKRKSFKNYFIKRSN